MIKTEQVAGLEVFSCLPARKTGRPPLLFIHGAGSDHSVWPLQSRYFAHHGWNVLADVKVFVFAVEANWRPWTANGLACIAAGASRT